jgi:hypothetical protein
MREARDPFDALLATNRRYVAMFRANRGLMRCLRLASDQVPAFAAVRRRHDRRWAGRIARSLARRAGRDDPDTRDLLTAYALGGMLDAVLDDLELRGDPELSAFRDPPERIEETLSLLWYRAVHAADPPRRPEDETP